jgi:hypothetical protein
MKSLDKQPSTSVSASACPASSAKHGASPLQPNGQSTSDQLLRLGFSQVTIALSSRFNHAPHVFLTFSSRFTAIIEGSGRREP